MHSFSHFVRFSSDCNYTAICSTRKQWYWFKVRFIVQILRAYAISTVQILTKCELLRLGWAEAACRPRWDSSLQQHIQTSPFMELEPHFTVYQATSAALVQCILSNVEIWGPQAKDSTKCSLYDCNSSNADSKSPHFTDRVQHKWWDADI